MRRNGWLQRKRNPSATCVAQAGEVGLALLLERRPHRESESDRERVRDGVDEERHGAAEREERAAERRPGEHHRRPSRPGAPSGCGQLLPGNDGAQRAGVSGVEEEAIPCPRRTRRPRSARTRPGRGGSWRRGVAIATARTPSAAIISRLRFQRSAATPAGRAKTAYGRSPAKPTMPACAGESRDREHEQRVRDRRHLRAERREQPPGLQQHEVPVPPQREWRNQCSRCCWRSARSTYPSGTLPTAVQPPST